jgi:hypothetical protein
LQNRIHEIMYCLVVVLKPRMGWCWNWHGMPGQ